MIKDNINNFLGALSIVILVLSIGTIGYAVFKPAPRIDGAKKVVLLSAEGAKPLENLTVDSNKPSFSTEVVFLIGTVASAIFLGVLADRLLVRRRRKQEVLTRDNARKSDLKRIAGAILVFQNKNGRLPNPERGEFEKILKTLIPAAQDPLRGKPTGFGEDLHDYYFEPETPRLFRVWGFLENLHDLEIDHNFDKNHRGYYSPNPSGPVEEEEVDQKTGESFSGISK